MWKLVYVCRLVESIATQHPGARAPHPRPRVEVDWLYLLGSPGPAPGTQPACRLLPDPPHGPLCTQKGASVPRAEGQSPIQATTMPGPSTSHHVARGRRWEVPRTLGEAS